MNYHNNLPKYSRYLYLLEDDPYVVYASFKEMLHENFAADAAIKAMEEQIAEMAAEEIEIALDNLLPK